MKKQVEIQKTDTIFSKHFFTIKEARLRHELFNGQMSDELTRLNFDRGDSAAVILHDPEADTVVLTEQFRYPTYEKGPGWLLEVPAGTVEKAEIDDPVKTLRREIVEEIGYTVSSFQKICSFYVSPGGTSERIHLYYARIAPKDRTGEGGGVLSEGEDIRVISVKVNAALRMIDEGKIIDAKSIIGLQWLQLHRAI